MKIIEWKSLKLSKTLFMQEFTCRREGTSSPSPSSFPLQLLFFSIFKNIDGDTCKQIKRCFFSMVE